MSPPRVSICLAFVIWLLASPSGAVYVNGDYSVAIYGSPVFVVSALNSSCMCPAYASSDLARRSTFGAVVATSFAGDGTPLNISLNPEVLALKAELAAAGQTIAELTQQVATLELQMSVLWGHFTTGSSGSTGSLASTGSSGSSGSVRSTGSTGSVRSTGSTGSIRSSGSTGSTGSVRSTGTTGSVGSTGSSGSSGSSGSVRSTGTTSTGTSGSTGSVGSTGTSGTTGSTGLPPPPPPPPRMIYAFAGTGEESFAGDGESALDAAFARLKGLAYAHSSDTLYVADAANHRVRAVSSDGVVRTVAGDGSATPSEDNVPAASTSLFNPNALAYDDANATLYVAEHNRIRTIGPDGLIRAFAGGGVSMPQDDIDAQLASLGTIRALAVSSEGVVYASDQGYNVIWKIVRGRLHVAVGTMFETGESPDGTMATQALLDGLVFGLAVDSDDNLLFSAETRCRVRNVSSADNRIRTVAGDVDGNDCLRGLSSPEGLAFDRATGRLFIADAGARRVVVRHPNGTLEAFAGNGSEFSSGDGGPALAASMDDVWSVAVGNNGVLYLTDLNRIRFVGFHHLVASQASGFSLTQGANGWSYLFSTAPDGARSPMTLNNDDCVSYPGIDRWCSAAISYGIIAQDFLVVNSPTLCSTGGSGYLGSHLRWNSTVAGTLRLGLTWFAHPCAGSSHRLSIDSDRNLLWRRDFTTTSTGSHTMFLTAHVSTLITLSLDPINGCHCSDTNTTFEIYHMSG